MADDLRDFLKTTDGTVSPITGRFKTSHFWALIET
jgi:hypothetical protein